MKLEPGEMDVGETDSLYLVEHKVGTEITRKLFREESDALDYILEQMDDGATYKAFVVKQFCLVTGGIEEQLHIILLKHLIRFRDEEMKRRSQHTNP
jgi:hypothetical protein